MALFQELNWIERKYLWFVNHRFISQPLYKSCRLGTYYEGPWKCLLTEAPLSAECADQIHKKENPQIILKTHKKFVVRMFVIQVHTQYDCDHHQSKQNHVVEVLIQTPSIKERFIFYKYSILPTWMYISQLFSSKLLNIKSLNEKQAV